MKNLSDYTEEIKSKINIYKDKCVNDLYNGTEHSLWKREYTVNYINYIYKLSNEKDKPVVVIADNIIEYKLYFNLLFNELYNKKSTKIINSVHKIINDPNSSSEDISNSEKLILDLKNDLSHMKTNLIKAETHYLFICSEYARVYLMWFKFIKDEFKLSTSVEEKLDWLYDNVNKSNMAKAFFCKNIVLVLRMPKKIKRNSVGFHSVDNEGAIIYDNQKLHYINGRSIPNWVFDKYFSKTLTFEDFVNEDNEDIKAGIITLIKENEGNEGLIKFLDAIKVDEQIIHHANNYSETMILYKTKSKYSFLKDSKGNTDVSYAWLSMNCPSTGSNYLIDTCPTFTDVLECAKWHRPNQINSKIPYFWQSAN